MGIYYDDIYITLTYNDSAVIGSHSLPSFYQGYRETTIYVVLVNADHLQQLWKGITNRTTVFRVCLENVVRYKIFRSQTKHHRIYNEAYVPVGSDGRMSGAKTIKLQHTSKLLRKT
ncbi:Protein NDR1 [Morella rubra]|nr:Protein NDR1 [Morella rubra]